MDEDQIAKLGDKMKSVYDDVQAHAEGTADQASRQVRTAARSSKKNARQAGGTFEAQLSSFVKERPITALLIAAGTGYVLFRLIQHR